MISHVLGDEDALINDLPWLNVHGVKVEAIDLCIFHSPQIYHTTWRVHIDDGRALCESVGVCGLPIPGRQQQKVTIWS